jgi:hypothetical protein
MYPLGFALKITLYLEGLNMIFSEGFLETLKSDPLGGTVEMAVIIRSKLSEDETGWHDSDYLVLLEAYALMCEIADSKLLEINRPPFEISGNKSEDCGKINKYLSALEGYCVSEASKLKVGSFRNHFKAFLSAGFTYEFSQGDLDRVQALINQVRDLISKATDLEKDHQRRLLARLEKLQTELHKKVSDLDRFWGLIGDAGVVLGKLGQDAKPIVDRIKEIADIVWQTQSRAEELPSGTQIPLLTNKPNSASDEA